jgi:hypothetical protein
LGIDTTPQSNDPFATQTKTPRTNTGHSQNNLSNNNTTNTHQGANNNSTTNGNQNDNSPETPHTVQITSNLLSFPFTIQDPTMTRLLAISYSRLGLNVVAQQVITNHLKGAYLTDLTATKIDCNSVNMVRVHQSEKIDQFLGNNQQLLSMLPQIEDKSAARSTTTTVDNDQLAFFGNKKRLNIGHLSLNLIKTPQIALLLANALTKSTTGDDTTNINKAKKKELLSQIIDDLAEKDEILAKMDENATILRSTKQMLIDLKGSDAIENGLMNQLKLFDKRISMYSGGLDEIICRQQDILVDSGLLDDDDLKANMNTSANDDDGDFEGADLNHYLAIEKYKHEAVAQKRAKFKRMQEIIAKNGASGIQLPSIDEIDALSGQNGDGLSDGYEDEDELMSSYKNNMAHCQNGKFKRQFKRLSTKDRYTLLHEYLTELLHADRKLLQFLYNRPLRLSRQYIMYTPSIKHQLTDSIDGGDNSNSTPNHQNQQSIKNSKQIFSIALDQLSETPAPVRHHQNQNRDSDDAINLSQQSRFALLEPSTNQRLDDELNQQFHDKSVFNPYTYTYIPKKSPINFNWSCCN